MLRRLLTAAAGFVLLQTPALASTHHIGTISMYSCDYGLDFCGNTLSSSPIYLSLGSFTEDFAFNFVNDFPDVPDNVPLLDATASLETSSSAEFGSATVMLYNALGMPLGFSTPFGPREAAYRAQAEDLIHPGMGYYLQVDGFSNAYGLPLEVSVSAFDLGPVDLPEPSTWSMILFGAAGLGFTVCRRTTRARVASSGSARRSASGRGTIAQGVGASPGK